MRSRHRFTPVPDRGRAAHRWDVDVGDLTAALGGSLGEEASRLVQLWGADASSIADDGGDVAAEVRFAVPTRAL